MSHVDDVATGNHAFADHHSTCGIQHLEGVRFKSADVHNDHIVGWVREGSERCSGLIHVGCHTCHNQADNVTFATVGIDFLNVDNAFFEEPNHTHIVGALTFDNHTTFHSPDVL